MKRYHMFLQTNQKVNSQKINRMLEAKISHFIIIVVKSLPIGVIMKKSEKNYYKI